MADGHLNLPCFVLVLCIIVGLAFLGCILCSRLKLAELMPNEDTPHQVIITRDQVAMPREEGATTAMKEKEQEVKKKARQKFLDCKLTSQLYKEDDLEGDNLERRCAICLSDYAEGERIAVATANPCTHKYHRECIADWLLGKKLCPVCREYFLLEDKMAHDEERGDTSQDIPVQESV